MFMLVQIYPPIPSNIDASYGDFGFRKLGVCCWQYSPDPNSQGLLYDGEVEFINSASFCTQPKYPNPRGFRYWFAPGVNGIIYPGITYRSDIPGILLNGVEYNPVTGENMPLPLLN